MGRTPRPLRLLVHPDLADAPEFEELRAKGHEIRTGLVDGDDPDQVWAYDAILSPTAWYMTKAHLKYLGLALKGARNHRYSNPKESKP